MNKNIIKLFAILVMCFVFVGVLVACGAKNEDNQAEDCGVCSAQCDCRNLQGIQGIQGEAGENGKTPEIGANGNWFIGGEDTGVPARAESLADCENHDWDSEPLRAHTITSTGVNILICKDCGDAAFEYINHSYTAVVTAPTCTAEGYTTYSCACGDVYVADTVAKVPHSYVAVVTAPDCYNQGYTTHTCSVCGDSYVDSYTAKLGHAAAVPFDANNVDTRVWHEADREDDINPCTTEPVYGADCVRCGLEIFETGIAPGHKYGAWEKAHNETNICDCEWNVYIKECTVCFDKQVSSDPAEIGNAYQVGHEYLGWKESKKPTATTEGELVNNCKNCSCCPKVQVLPVLSATSTDYVVTTVAAECEKNGTITYTYTIDGATFNYYESIPMTGHTYSANSTVEVIKLPTDAEEGTATIACDKCGATKSIVLPKLEQGAYVVAPDANNCEAQYTHIIEINGHKIEVSFNIVGSYIHVEHTTEPTYEVEGEYFIYTVYRCTRCNEWVVINAVPYN